MSDYALYSLYTLSVGLLICLVLGTLRQIIARINIVAGVAVFLIAFSACFLIVDEVAHWLLFGSLSLNSMELLRMLLATLLLGGIVARGMFLLQVLEDRNKAELQLKVDALQARINPHFLFNSLNSISELTATKPNLAEDAIQSLAMLFRISLESRETQHSLNDEIVLCERYISLESVRFDGGINFLLESTVVEPAAWLIPKLILQPLLENAVKYGAVNDVSEPIRLSISETNSDISIRVVNKVVLNNGSEAGNGIAVQNIKDRLFVLYEGTYTFNQRTVDGKYYVFIQLPKINTKSRAAGLAAR